MGCPELNSLIEFQEKINDVMNSGELKVDVPLAATEESDCDDGSSDNQSHTPKRGTNHLPSLPKSTPPNSTSTPKRLDPNQKNDTTARKASPRFNIDTGGDSVTGSLEDLVSSFDEKITMCFRDYQEQVDKILTSENYFDQREEEINANTQLPFLSSPM